MRPAALDKTKPYAVIRGQAPYRFTQVVDDVLYGFDHNGMLVYDGSKDPNAPPLPKQQQRVTNVPKQFSNKKLDRKRPYGTARGVGVTYRYFQDHMGFDEDGNPVYAEPGHWGVPTQEAMENIPEPPKPEPVADTIQPDNGGMIIDEPEGDEIYPLKYLQSLSDNEIKALWFQHNLGDWRGKRGKPAKIKAIEVLSTLRAGDGDDISAASPGID